jgi:hypothetical protein
MISSPSTFVGFFGCDGRYREILAYSHVVPRNFIFSSGALCTCMFLFSVVLFWLLIAFVFPQACLIVQCCNWISLTSVTSLCINEKALFLKFGAVQISWLFYT